MKRIADPETRQLLGEPRYHSLTERVELMERALETGGAQNAFQFGQDMGELIWDTCTAVISTYGTVKGGAELAKVGFKLGAPGVRGLAASAANVATRSLNRAAAGSGVKAVKAPSTAKGAELASKVVGKLATRAAVKPAHATVVPVKLPGESANSAISKKAVAERLEDVKRTTGAIDTASGIAFNSLRNVDEWVPKDKHMIGTIANRSAQFSTNNVSEIRGLVKEALSSPGSKFVPNNINGSFRMIFDMGRPIGTKGQTNIRIIIGNDGKIWNAFPVSTQ